MKKILPFLAFLLSFFFADFAFAVGTASEDITNAVANGQANVEAVGAGLIAMAAVFAGIGFIISAFKKS